MISISNVALGIFTLTTLLIAFIGTLAITNNMLLALVVALFNALEFVVLIAIVEAWCIE